MPRREREDSNRNSTICLSAWLLQANSLQSSSELRHAGSSDPSGHQAPHPWRGDHLSPCGTHIIWRLLCSGQHPQPIRHTDRIVRYLRVQHLPRHHHQVRPRERRLRPGLGSTRPVRPVRLHQTFFCFPLGNKNADLRFSVHVSGDRLSLSKELHQGIPRYIHRNSILSHL